mmetsp:Transcript_29819/g.73925  ORF Transcript_29819/g.73925 Transcript_29819/m.73925 type:complete len:247 (-) Transcript_29819:340-1080(-)
MSSLHDLYGVARRLTVEIQGGLEQLEGAEARGIIQASTSLSRDMHSKLRELQKVSQQMESRWRFLVVQENASKRDLWKRKVEQVAEDTDQFRVVMERFKGRENRRQAEEKDSEELMQRVTSDDEFRLLVDSYDAEAGAKISIQRSGGMVDDLLASGASVLSALVDQKDRLRGAHNKALDLLNTIGVSASLLSVIDRRQRMDAMMVYGGMAFTCILLLFMWLWLRSGVAGKTHAVVEARVDALVVAS